MLVQPEAADDVAAALADVAVNEPVNGIVELAAPSRSGSTSSPGASSSANNDPRRVTADVHARYFGAELDEHSLTPGDNARIAPTRFEDWLSQSAAGKRTSRPKGDPHETDDRSRPRRVRRVCELGRRHRPAARTRATP